MACKTELRRGQAQAVLRWSERLDQRRLLRGSSESASESFQHRRSPSIQFSIITLFAAPSTRTRLAVNPRAARRQLAHVCRVVEHRPATFRALRLVPHFESISRRQRH